jgi:NAD(P)-dependent dehydrogenase (short-subunit alcohol dehydrogenase family)
LVLTDDPMIARQLPGLAEPGATTVLVPPEAAAWNEQAVSQLLTTGRPAPGHLRVVTSLRAAVWPAPPRQRLLALQEAVFVAVKRLANAGVPATASLAVLVLDPLEGGIPHPHGALLTGLTKAVRAELPWMDSHAVVTDETTLDAALDQLRRESGCTRGLPTAYYVGRQRSAMRLEERLLVGAETTASAPSTAGPAGPVVVAVGGARGITARCVEGLRATPSMLWLLGSTARDVMLAQTLEIESESCAEYVRRRRAEEPDVSVRQLRRTFERCRKSRESVAAIAALRRRIGAERVRYLECDITDPDAVRRVAEVIHRATPQVDLLVNGAGISGARRWAAKDLTTFRAVRDTKVLGYHHLKAAFDDIGLWCNFGSIAGAFGLAGECDYGPANDMLSAAARYEAQAGKAECSINWSMWGESGLGPRAGFTQYMVTAGQLGLLSDGEGQRLFNNEVEDRGPGRRSVPVPLGEVEQVLVRTRFPELLDAPRPYLGEPMREDGREAVWELDLARHAHLHGHVRESRALLPGALALELAAEAAVHLTGVTPVGIFRNIRFLAPIAVVPRIARYRLTASFTPAGFDRGIVEVAIHSWSPAEGDGLRPVRFFDAVVPVGDVIVPAPPTECTTATTVPRAAATMAMSGLFDQVRDVRLESAATSARWAPHLSTDVDPRFFSQQHIPWLLTDALLQAACATGTTGRYATPRSIDALRVHTTDDDLRLSASESNPVTFDVVHRDNRSGGVAIRGGEMLLEMTGIALSGRTAHRRVS